MFTEALKKLGAKPREPVGPEGGGFTDALRELGAQPHDPFSALDNIGPAGPSLELQQEQHLDNRRQAAYLRNQMAIDPQQFADGLSLSEPHFNKLGLPEEWQPGFVPADAPAWMGQMPTDELARVERLRQAAADASLAAGLERGTEEEIREQKEAAKARVVDYKTEKAILDAKQRRYETEHEGFKATGLSPEDYASRLEAEKALGGEKSVMPVGVENMPAIARGVIQGIGNAGETAMGLAAKHALGDDDLYNYIHEQKGKDAGRNSAAVAYAPETRAMTPVIGQENAEWVTSMAEGASSSVAQSLAMGFMTGGLGGVAVGFGIQAADDAFYEAKQKGLSDREARQYALESGLIEASVTMLAGKIAGRFGGTTAESQAAGVGKALTEGAKKTLREKVKGALVGGGAELTEENTIEFISALAGQVHGVRDPLTLESAWELFRDTSTQALMAKGGTAAVDAAANKLGALANERLPEEGPIPDETTEIAPEAEAEAATQPEPPPEAPRPEITPEDAPTQQEAAQEPTEATPPVEGGGVEVPASVVEGIDPTYSEDGVDFFVLPNGNIVQRNEDGDRIAHGEFTRGDFQAYQGWTDDDIAWLYQEAGLDPDQAGSTEAPIQETPQPEPEVAPEPPPENPAVSDAPEVTPEPGSNTPDVPEQESTPPEEAPNTTGSPRSLMDRPVGRMSSFTDENGITYELYQNTNGDGGVVRAVDSDSGNVVSITQHPTFQDADAAHIKLIEDIQQIQDPPPPKKLGDPPSGIETPATPPEVQVDQSTEPEAPPEQEGGWKQIGTNANGKPLYEDENGVRSYVEGGVRITESVGVVPGHGIVVDKDRRGGDYLTSDEVAASQKPPKKLGDSRRTPDATKQDSPQEPDSLPNESATESESEVEVSVEPESPDKSYTDDELVSMLSKASGEEAQIVEPQDDTDREVKEFLEGRGQKVRFFTGGGRSRGGQAGDTILMRSGLGQEAVWFTIGHELAHNTKIDLSDEFDAKLVEEMAKVYFDRTAGTPYSSRVKDSPIHRKREGIAELVGRAFQDPEFRKQLQGEHQSLWKQIVEALRNLLGQTDPNSEIYKQIASLVNEKAPQKADESGQNPAKSGQQADGRLGDADAKGVIDDVLDGLLAEESTGPAPEKKTVKKKKAKKKFAKKKKAPRKKLGDRAADARKQAEDDWKEAFDAIGKQLKKGPKTSMNLDPELARPILKAALSTVKAGALTFAEYAEFMIERFPGHIQQFKPYIEYGWDGLYRRGIVSDPAGNVDDYLEKDDDNQSGSEEDQEGSGSPGDVGGSPGGGTDGDVEGSSADSPQGADGSGSSGGIREPAGGGVSGREESSDGHGADGQRSSDDSGRDADGDGRGRDRAPDASRPNYHLTDPESIIGGGPKAKFGRNQKALEIAEEIGQDNRPPTQEELDTLAGYTGWGAFGQELFQGTWSNPRPKEGWEDESEWLRQHLGQEEWDSAKRSILNAHYTDPETSSAMWGMLERAGFKGGRVLEPSAGIGNFFATMPRSLMANSTLTGIELDQATARIAKILYPHANIQQKGYEESQTPNDFYDVVISNVPFGDYKIPDRRYPRNYRIHNYFFRKAMDQVKPGGLVMFITSSGTMDGTTEAKYLRGQLAKEADLVGAFRLPTGAFQRYAGTKVVADIVILRKRADGEESSGVEWTGVKPVQTPSGPAVNVNEYFAEHPENILGTLNFGSGTTRGRPGMIVDQPADLAAELQKAIATIPQATFGAKQGKADRQTLVNNTGRLQNSVIHEKGKLFTVKGEHLVPFEGYYRKNSKKETIAKKKREVVGLLGVRDALAEVLKAQVNGDAAKERKKLNDAYGKHTKKYGYIRDSQAARSLERAGDPLAFSLLALEGDKVNGKRGKASIFSKNTARSKRSLENPSLEDAYAAARNQSLSIDWDAIADAAGISKQNAIKKLVDDGSAIKAGEDLFVPTDLFLSGNISSKIRELEAAKQEGVGDLEPSIAALKEVEPEPVPYTLIKANLGATWIPNGDYIDFLEFLLNDKDGGNIEVNVGSRGYGVRIGEDLVAGASARQEHGHSDVRFNKLVEAAMNNATITIRRKTADGSKYVDEVATKEVNAKIEELREKFKDWVWSHPARSNRLSRDYNEIFNSVIEPNYSSVPLLFEGLAVEKGDDPLSLRVHQMKAIWRGIVTGKGMYAHEVGTGKTMTMAGLAMESRRLGLANKPLLLAHNANSREIAKEMQRLYPGAKVLYTGDMTWRDRDIALGSIANEDWDVVVMPHSQVGKLMMRPETLENLLREQLDQLEADARDAFEESDTEYKGTFPGNIDEVSDEDLTKLKEPTAKELVRERNRLVAKIREAQQALTSGNATFMEDMGIDMVMVDEYHEFKKTPISTRQSMKGLNKSGSQRGITLSLIADYVRSVNSGRGVHLFTGTPITNTLNEVYNFSRLVVGDEMRAAKVHGWDGWFNAFATEEMDTEFTSGGTLEAVTRLRGFQNLPELQRLVRQHMDVVFADDMPEFVEREEREGRSENPVGRPHKKIVNETLGMTPEQKAHSDELRRRYISFKKSSGKEKKEIMNSGDRRSPIIIETEGIKLALDPRLTGIGFDPDAPNQTAADFDRHNPDLKVNKAVANAMQYYHEDTKSTQMFFMETGFSDTVKRERSDGQGGKIKTTHRVFNLAKELKARLIEEGVDPSEIAIFSNLTAKRRAEAADKMLRGEIRFAIGSTQTMGTGVNAQTHMAAMHHLDAPWTPGELEQRNGRGHRQGNQWNTIHEHRYLTEGPQDGRRWQVLLTKARFIEAFLKFEQGIREIDMDDIDISDDGSVDMEQTFSAAAGDPRILLLTKLEKKVEKLKASRDRHAVSVQNAAWTIEDGEKSMEHRRQVLELHQKDAETYGANKPEEGARPKITLEGKEYEGADVIKPVVDRIGERYKGEHDEVQIGEFYGVPIFAENGNIFVGEARNSAGWSFQSLNYWVRRGKSLAEEAQQDITRGQKEMESLERIVTQPWMEEEKLAREEAKLKALKLDRKTNPTPPPAWFRNATPVGTKVFYKGEPYIVAGHRGTGWILYEKGNGWEKLPAKDVTDEGGERLYDPADLETFKPPKKKRIGKRPLDKSGKVQARKFGGPKRKRIKTRPHAKSGKVKARKKPGGEPLQLSSGPVPNTLGRKKTLFEKIKGGFKKWFHSAGELPREVFDLIVKKDGRVNSEMRDMAHSIAELADAAVAEGLVGKGGKVKAGDQERINQALQGNPRAMRKLPQSIQDVVTQMRDHIDKLSQAFIDTGIAQGDLELTFTKHMGMYVTRSYQIFDDPKWVENIPQEVLNRAVSFFRSQEPSLTNDQIEVLLSNLLADKQGALGEYLSGKGVRLGEKRLGILKKRQNVPPEIRALLGEYKDPVVNYTKTIDKMADLLANHEFLKEVIDEGQGKWLFEDKDLDRPKKDHAYPIAIKGDERMAPLAGLRTSKEIADEFQRFYSHPDMNAWLKTYGWWVTAAKINKTVFSTQTHARNFIANPEFLLSNGINPVDRKNIRKAMGAMGEDVRSSLPGSLRRTADKVTGRKLGANVDQNMKNLQRYIALGLVRDSTHAGELRDIMRTYLDSTPDEFIQFRVDRGLKAAANVAAKFYEVEDSFWKVVYFEAERARYKKAYGKAGITKTDKELDREVADIVRRVMPTYSRAPRAIKALARFPFLASFPTFAAEVYRTKVASLMLAVEERKNPALRDIGNVRLAWNVGTTFALPTLLGAITAYAFGVDDDDDDSVRELVADWSKNDTLVWNGKPKNGEVSAWSLSYSSPTSEFLGNPVRAALAEESIPAATKAALKEFLGPFTDGDILSVAIGEVIWNTRKGRGGKVYNDQDPNWPIEASKHIVGALTPGFIESAKRNYKAVSGYVEPWGKTYSTSQEVVSATTGFRPINLKAQDAIKWKAGDYARAKADTHGGFNSVLTSLGNVSDSKIVSKYKSMERNRRKHWEVMKKKADAGLHLGATYREVYESMVAGGVGQGDARSILAGAYTPYKLSPSVAKRALAAPGGLERLKAFRRAEAAMRGDE